jgi:hypothetical protein
MDVWLRFATHFVPLVEAVPPGGLPVRHGAVKRLYSHPY